MFLACKHRYVYYVIRGYAKNYSSQYPCTLILLVCTNGNVLCSFQAYHGKLISGCKLVCLKRNHLNVGKYLFPAFVSDRPSSEIGYWDVCKRFLVSLHDNTHNGFPKSWMLACLPSQCHLTFMVNSLNKCQNVSYYIM